MSDLINKIYELTSDGYDIAFHRTDGPDGMAIIVSKGMERCVRYINWITAGQYKDLAAVYAINDAVAEMETPTHATN